MSEPIRFAVQAPADDLSGLVRTLSLLRSINAYLVSINTGFAGLRQVTLPERSVESFAEQIKQLADKLTPTAFVRGTKATALVDQLLGPEARAAFERQIQSFRRRFQEAFRGDSFADPGSAARVVQSLNEQVRTEQFRDARRLRQMLGDAAERGVRPGQPATAAAAGPVAATIAGGQVGLSIGPDRLTVILGPGPIPLTVPADRIQATLGPGTVVTSVDQLRAAVGSPAPAASGSAAPAPATGASSRRTVSLDESGMVEPRVIDESPDEISRRIRQTAKSARTSIKRSVDQFTQITETFDEQGGLLGTDAVRNRAAGAATRIRERVALAQQEAARAELSAAPSGSVDRLRQRAEILRLQTQRISEAVEAEAEVLQQTGQSAMLARLRAQSLKDVVAANRIDQRATDLEASQRKSASREVLAAVGRSNRADQAARRATEAEDLAMVQGAVRTRRQRSRIEAAAAKAQAEAERRAREAFGETQSAQAAALSAQAGRSRANELLDPASGYRRTRRTTNDAFRKSGGFSGVETLVFEKDEGGTRFIETVRIARRNNEDFAASVERTERALRATRREAGAAGRNFIQNTQQVTTWAASVGVLYGAIGLLRSGLSSFIQTSYQVQRLEVVFGGVGGSARQLAADVTQLAAANGRATDEALASAIAWSRLNLTRRQVNEAVRVSLVAANVAEIDAAQATENLQGVYQSYRLEVGQLAGTLAQLNEVSNTTNATVAELFDGLARVAPAAAQAQVPLRTLVGYLGQMISQTKQSGANIGNALKTFVGRLSTPEMLRQIRDDFGVQISDENGAQKDFLGTLDAVYERYQQLTAAEKNALLVRVAGNTQLNRLAALMDGYIRAQVLAINTQLRLNSAEAENEKIRETLRNRLQGLVSEMQRFAQIQGENGPGQALGALAEGLQNLVKIANLPGVNVGFTGLIGLLGVLGARAVITKARMDSLAGTPGFLGRSWAAMSESIRKLGREMTGLWQAAAPAGMMQARPRLRMAGQAASAGPAVAGGAGAGLAAVVGTASMQAWARVQQVFVFLWRVLGRVVGWVAVAGVALAGFNKAMEWLGRSSAGADKELTALTAALEGADARVNATADSIRLLDTVLRLLPSASAEARQQILKDLSDLPDGIGLSAGEIEAGKGDALAAVSAVQAARDRAFQAQVAAQQDSFQRAQAVVRRTEEELKRLQSKWFPDKELITQKSAELAQARGQAMQQRLRVRETMDTGGEDGDTGEEARRKFAEVLEARATIIRSIFNESSLDGPSQRLRAQIESEKAVLLGLRQSRSADDEARRRESRTSAGLREEANRLRDEATARRALASERTPLSARTTSLGYRVATIGGLLESDIFGGDTYAMNLAEQASQMEQQAAATDARAQTPAMRAIDARLEVTATKIREAENKLRQLESLGELTGLQDGLERGRRQGTQSLIPFAFGRSETETVQRQIQAAERMLGESGTGPAGIEELGRREALITELGRLRQEQNRRELDVQREINALIEQRTREFERQVALASPADLLRTLAAIQTARQGLTAGQFLAAGDLRQRIVELPGFGDQERALSREAAVLARARSRGNPGRLDTELSQVEAQIGKLLGSASTRVPDEGAATAAVTATRELGGLATAAGAGAAALAKLTAALGVMEEKIAMLAQPGQRRPLQAAQAGGTSGGF